MYRKSSYRSSPVKLKDFCIYNRWNYEKGTVRVTYSLAHPGSRVTTFSVISDDAVVSGAADGTVKLWDLNTGELLHSTSIPGSVFSLLSCDDTILAGSQQLVYQWAFKAGKLAEAFDGHSTPVRIMVRVQGSVIASGSDDGSVRVWDFSNVSRSPGVRRNIDKGHRSPVSRLVMLHHSNGHRYIVSASVPWMGVEEGLEDRLVKVWNQAGACTRTFRLAHWVTGLVVAGDSLITADANMVYVWDIVGASCLQKWEVPRIQVMEAAGDILLVVSDCLVKIFTLDGQLQGIYRKHRDYIFHLAADAQTVISESRDRSLKIWNPRAFHHIRSLHVPAQGSLGGIQVHKHMVFTSPFVLQVWKLY